MTGTCLKDKSSFYTSVIYMKKISMFEEEGNVPEMMRNANPMLWFRLQFLNKNESQTVHKVDVRSINLQDLLRHLRQGESVLITPKLQENFSGDVKIEDRASWYFTHM